MPNHVENDLRITGNIDKVKAFFAAVRSDGQWIDADKLIPYPQYFKSLDAAVEDWKMLNPNPQGDDWKTCPKDGFNSGGYEWCCENWGTKWGFYEATVPQYTPRGATISFQSAWSPGLPLIDAMGHKFPGLKFTLRYYEGGSGYKGIYVVKDGEVLRNERSEYRGRRGG